MGLQSFLVILAVACVPCMLIVKTLVMRRQYLWKKHLVRWKKSVAPHTLYTSDTVVICIFLHAVWQGTQNFGGIRIGNGPTEDEAEIIQHDQLSQHSEEEPEVKQGMSSSLTSKPKAQGNACYKIFSRLWIIQLLHHKWKLMAHVSISTVAPTNINYRKEFALEKRFNDFIIHPFAVTNVAEKLNQRYVLTQYFHPF